MTTVLSSHVAPSLEAETLAPFYQLIPGKLSAVISKKKRTRTKCNSPVSNPTTQSRFHYLPRKQDALNGAYQTILSGKDRMSCTLHR